ncbi:MAG: glycine/sarcosine/betaine reductase complex component C subunit alpha [Ruthenibacterium sp.]
MHDAQGAKSAQENDVRRMLAKTFLELREGLLTGSTGAVPRIVVTGLGSELGEQAVLDGAVAAAKAGGVQVLYLGTLHAPQVLCVPVQSEDEARDKMEAMLRSGEADGAVTMHYPFPIGVATVGRLRAPATGREFYLATTTGTADTDRVAAMVKGAVYGVAVAKCCGREAPTVGIVNVDGARATETVLKKLAAGGWDVQFGASQRAEGGVVLRGNDVLCGACDVVVCDSLTGNLLMKLLSAFTSGGSVETTGSGYGPGAGGQFDRVVGIVSRASGAAVIAGAVAYAAQAVRGKLSACVQTELAAAERAGLARLLAPKAAVAGTATQPAGKAPEKEVVTSQLAGIEILDLENAVQTLWAAGIYAESGMGCTGPVVRVSDAKLSAARALLVEKEYLGE